MAKFLGSLLAACLCLTGCGGDGEAEEPPPPVQPVGHPYRIWHFRTLDTVGRLSDITRKERGAGEVRDTHKFGDLALIISGKDLSADGEVYSSADGVTYWVEAEAPIGNVGDPTGVIGGHTRLTQHQRYRKLAANATLKLVVTEARIESADFNGTASLGAHCPWAQSSELDKRCFDRMYGDLRMDVAVWLEPTGEYMDHHNGGMELQGWGDRWETVPYMYINLPGSKPIFTFDNTVAEPVSSSGIGGSVGAIYRITQPVTVDLDLSKIPVDAEFTVWSTVTAQADNRRGRESYLGARLRDPVQAGGMRVESTGLLALATPSADPPSAPPEQFSCSADATGPEAGKVEFSAAGYHEPEFGKPGPTVFIHRTGGKRGDLVVTFRSEDDTALAGIHYEPALQRIAFPDGDDTPRAVELRLIDNDLAEGDRRVRLLLEADEGCATLGDRDSALLYIVDDDLIVETPSYSVGGTVAGLQGSGLVVDEIRTGNRLTPGNGDFTFPYEFSLGDQYEVRIVSQPTSPLQVCRVENGAGIVEGDVRDVAIVCESPPASATLDPDFGSGGRVTGLLPGEGRAVALQPDGKLVVLGKAHLARFTANGTLDATFGSNGIAPVTFNGVFGEEAMDLALQPDGRIVVAGFTRAAPTTLDYDFAVARFETNGAPDTSFGSGGLATVDFDGEPDKAESLVLQPDGRIVVGGYASTRVPVGSITELRTGFGVARLDVDGALDTGFGGGGKVKAVGGSSFAHVLALQSDGKILAAGRSASDGASEPWAALARWHPDGTPDTDEDHDPEVYLGVDGSGEGRDVFNGSSDIVRDLIITPNGRIFAVLRSPLVKENLVFAELVLPFGQAIGRPSSIHGVQVPIGPGTDYGDAVVEDAAGRYVVVGAASSASTVTDFAVVRFNASLSLDETFDEDGKLTIDFFGGADAANDVLIQPDGKIVIVGVAWNGASYGFAMARVLP